MSCSLLGLHKEPVGTNFISFGYLRDGGLPTADGSTKSVENSSMGGGYAMIFTRIYKSNNTSASTLAEGAVLQWIAILYVLLSCVCVCSASVGI